MLKRSRSSQEHLSRGKKRRRQSTVSPSQQARAKHLATTRESLSIIPKNLWRKGLKSKVEAAARRRPRFLFAAGTGADGDSAIFHPQSGITPLFFLGAPMPETIFRMPLNELRDHNEATFLGEGPDRSKHALWTSWEASLQSAILKAIDISEEDENCSLDDIFVAVLDTKGLTSRNLIIHDKDFHLLEHPDRISESVEDVFLAFGTLPSNAFKMVPLSVLYRPWTWEDVLGMPRVLKTGPPVRLPDLFNATGAQRIDSFTDEVVKSKKLGMFFGDYFALPVACMAIAALSCHPEHHVDWLSDDSELKSLAVNKLSDLSVDPRWKRDHSIAREKASSLISADARSGMNLLRAIVKISKSRSTTHPGNSVDTQAPDMLNRTQLETITNLQKLRHEDDQNLLSPSHSPSHSQTSDDNISNEHAIALPKGDMDDDTKKILLYALKKTPRYLFRAWRNGPSRYSGGFKDLNTEEAITPLAFLQKRCRLEKTVYDLSRSGLKNMCIKHLEGQRIYSEFSSWASSLRIAFKFVREGHPEEAFLSIIDTKELPKSVLIFHVPSLAPILGTVGYHHEYLAHGVIKGVSHKAVSLVHMMHAGIYPRYSLKMPMRLNPTRNPYPLINEAEIQSARSVAIHYSPQFRAAVTIAILCLRQRDVMFWRNGTNGVEIKLNDSISDFEIPAQLRHDATIVTDIVYTDGYEEVEQMIRMLRALVFLRYRKAKRTSTWKLAAR